MKKNLLIALVVCLASVAGFAQTFNTVRVNIPYPVIVGNVTLPAGDFVITDANHNGSSSVVVVRSEAGPAATLLMERTKDQKNPFATTSNVQLRPGPSGYEIDSLQINGNDYKPLR